MPKNAVVYKTHPICPMKMHRLTPRDTWKKNFSFIFWLNLFFQFLQLYSIKKAIFGFIFSEWIKCVSSFSTIITTNKLQVDWIWIFQGDEFRFHFDFEIFRKLRLEIFYWDILIQRYKYGCWYFWLELNQTPLKYFE